MYTDRETQKIKIKVLLCLSEMDGHDRGVRYIVKKLVEAGMEVVFITYGMNHEIIDTAIQENVDVIGISSSTGGHLSVISDITIALKARKIDDKLIIVGGIVPDADIPALLQMGVGKVFGPGTQSKDVANYIKGYFGQLK